jgi:hypothetical protein
MTESTGSATTFRASKALAEGLFAQAHASKLSKLTRLNLASNLLGDEWVARMVPSLLSLPLLQDLDISSNLLGNATLDCLGRQILRHSPGSLALRSLNIGKNRFQDIQTAALVNICMGHLQLECLNLETTFSGTYVSEELLQDSSDWPARTVVVILNGNPNLPHALQLQDKYPNVVVDNDQNQHQVVQQPRLSEDSTVPVRDIFFTDTASHQKWRTKHRETPSSVNKPRKTPSSVVQPRMVAVKPQETPRAKPRETPNLGARNVSPFPRQPSFSKTRRDGPFIWNLVVPEFVSPTTVERMRLLPFLSELSINLATGQPRHCSPMAMSGTDLV